MSLNKTNIGLLLGDPSGIGPELTVKLLDSNVSEKANILIIGEKKVLEDGQEIAGKKIDLKFLKVQTDHTLRNRFVPSQVKVF